MEPVNGIELAKRVHKAPDSPNRFIPMIMITGHSEKLRITEARDAGINEILIKPISATQLYQHIKSVIDRPGNLSNQKTISGPTGAVGGTPIIPAPNGAPMPDRKAKQTLSPNRAAEPAN